MDDRHRLLGNSRSDTIGIEIQEKVIVSGALPHS